MSSVAVESDPVAAEVPASTGDSFLSSLVSESPASDAPTSETPATTAPAVGEASTEPAPAVTPGKKPAPVAAAPATPAPVEKKFKIRGREYTAASLAAEVTARPDFAEDLAQSYEQLPHLTRKHQEVLERAAAANTQPKGNERPAAPESNAPAFTPEMLKVAYGPMIEERVKAGFLSQDFVELYPEMTAAYMHDRAQIEAMAEKVAQFEGLVNQAREHGARRSVGERLSNVIEQVRAEGGVYDGLKDAGLRQGFAQYLIGLNLELDRITPEVGKELFVAFQRPAFVEASNRLAAQEAAAAEEALRNSAGASGGHAPRATPQQLDHLANLFR